ncbi:Uncharacterised protein [Mycobacteroides abscessus subsp. abscessus]|nr:Uncharacterised protein [Mycobacteroides abscessus subsp. abscessus]
MSVIPKSATAAAMSTCNTKGIDDGHQVWNGESSATAGTTSTVSSSAVSFTKACAASRGASPIDSFHSAE